jgi:hypothetical protein
MVSIALLLILGGIAFSLLEVRAMEPLLVVPDVEVLPQWLVSALSGASIAVFVGVMFGFILLVYFMGQGRNWARITILVIDVGLFTLGVGILGESLNLPYDLVDGIALVLLFIPSSSAWFREMKSYRESIAAS